MLFSSCTLFKPESDFPAAESPEINFLGGFQIKKRAHHDKDIMGLIVKSALLLLREKAKEKNNLPGFISPALIYWVEN